ncbi:MAG: DUF6869 domain-containing protein [Pseudomonadota bacterium]
MRKKQRVDAIVVERSDQELEALLSLYLVREDEAFEAVSAMSAYDPQQCWRFLEIARRADLSDLQLALLSAGPFEEMMKRHGGDFIARVEEAAYADPKMRVLIAGLWRAGMSGELWDRIVALRTRLGLAPI